MKTAFQLFDTLLEPCFVLNQESKIVYCNETAATLCGVTARKAQRMTFKEILSFNEPIDWLADLGTVTEATPYKEVHYKNSDQVEGKIQITCQETTPGEAGERLWLVFVRDVTLEERLQKKYRGELEQKEGYILELQKAQSELEKYSKNLEKMVAERTAELNQVNQLMAALLDSLGQGFFVFDAAGKCMDFSSKACESVLEGRPNHKFVWEALKLPTTQVEGFKKWMTTLFAEMLPFEDLAVLGPNIFPHSQGQHIKIEYFPLKEDSAMKGVVVVASNITSLVEAQREAASERENARLILNLVNKKHQIIRFVRETQIILHGLQEFLLKPHEQWDLDEIFRCLHTVKGGCASYNVMPTAEAAHEAENRLQNFRKDPSGANADNLRRQTVYVLTAFETFLAESRAIFGPVAFSEERYIEIPVTEIHAICQEIHPYSQLKPLQLSLQQRFICEPIKDFFEPYNDVLLKVAEQEGKSVQPLAIVNGELPILPEAYASLFATFVHVFRNAVDHGIEAPPVRREWGKAPAGLVQVTFEKLANHLRITVQDDGGGISPTRVREKLDKMGFAHASESDEQVIQHIFDASFSTRDAVTELSGRGIGMSAVKSSAEALGGNCKVQSTLGEGSKLIVEVPWLDIPPQWAEKDAKKSSAA